MYELPLLVMKWTVNYDVITIRHIETCEKLSRCGIIVNYGLIMLCLNQSDTCITAMKVSLVTPLLCWCMALQWLHNERDGVSNHQPHDCLLNRLFGHRSKKTSKLRVTGLRAGNSPGTGEFPSNADDGSIWWRHHIIYAWQSREQIRWTPSWRHKQFAIL